MREIKFRAWHKFSRYMCQVREIEFNEHGVPMCVQGGGVFNDFQPSEIELMQFTGLRDKNGKEIYEGDILADEEGDLYEVEFDDDQFQPVSRGGGAPVVSESIVDVADYSSIVGNIWENPELMEVRDE